MRATPIQVVLLRVPGDLESERYARAVRSAFEASALTGSYLAGGLHTGVPVLQPKDPTVLDFARRYGRRMLAAAAVTVIVEIQPHPKSPSLSRAVQRLRALQGERHQTHHVREQVAPPIAQGRIQVYRPSEYELEKGLRSTQLALTVMNRVRILLAEERGQQDKLKLFLSHAKVDGIPVAVSLLNLIEQLRSPHARRRRASAGVFYDAISIAPGQDWVRALKDNAANSVLIALRTEEYEGRFWCRQEFLTAEENGMPILVVDLRTGQQQQPERLPLGRANTVRVHDGNLIRVVFCALACHIRSLRMQCAVARMLPGTGSAPPFEVLSHHATEVSLLGARDRLLERVQSIGAAGAYVVYPEPRATTPFLRAAEAILDTEGTGIRLCTIDEVMSYTQEERSQ